MLAALLLALTTTLAGPAQDIKTKPETGDRHPYRVDRSIPEPVLFAPGVISTGDDESHPAFTQDGRTLYFLKNTPSFDFWTIVTSRYENNRWTTPEVAPFSGQFSDADPFITADGSRFFFISTRPVAGQPKQDTDIWVMDRTPNGWSEPRHLGSPVNSDKSEWFPTVSKSGTLYFGSGRSDGKGMTDIYRCRPINGAYSKVENLGGPINTAGDEVEPLIAPDESFLIFAAYNRPGGAGAFDLFVTYNRNGVWTSPVRLGAKINSEAWDFSPKLSPDGRYFFFTSSRGHGRAPRPKRLEYDELTALIRSPRNGLRDIYFVDIDALNLEGRPINR
jgi:Tol biopolymer transport system component